MKNRIFINGSIPQWKGNIHMHTTRSDGKLEPKQAAEAYKNNGYDFCMISDHEIYWDSNALDTDNFLVLGGTETSIRMNSDCKWLIDYKTGKDDLNSVLHTYMHYCCIKDETAGNSAMYFKHDESVPRTTDTGIDSWNNHVRLMREHNNMVILNHPNWSRMEPALLLASDVSIFEVWNSGNVYVCGGRSDEDIWDYCLQRGKRLLAVAADDAHAYATDFASGFTMVLADKLSKQALCKAFNSGDFYASCGPVIYDMRIEDGRLKMHFSPVRSAVICGYPADGITIYPDKDGFIETIDWEIPSNLKYLRPMLVDEAGNKAWAQPVFISDLIETK